MFIHQPLPCALKDHVSKDPFMGKAFKKQLNDLYQELSSSEKHFIRCVKPNTQKSRDKFDEKLVYGQMAAAGIMNAVEVRKQGLIIVAHRRQSSCS